MKNLNYSKMTNINIIRRKIEAITTVGLITIFMFISFSSCSSKTSEKQPAELHEDFFTLSLTDVKDTLNVDIENGLLFRCSF